MVTLAPQDFARIDEFLPRHDFGASYAIRINAPDFVQIPITPTTLSGGRHSEKSPAFAGSAIGRGTRAGSFQATPRLKKWQFELTGHSSHFGFARLQICWPCCFTSR
jgi:hypothetical protein